MSFDWKKALGGIAPAIVESLVPGGPLVRAGLNAALNAFGVGEADVPDNEQDATTLLAQKVQSATPEQLLALKQADNDMAKFMEKIDYKRDALYVEDTQNARAAHGDDNKVFWLGVMVLLTFATVMASALYGSYKIITGGMGTDLDAGIVAAVFGFLGTVVGYVAANAQQVVSFFFGSSRGSKQKTDAMAEAFKGLSMGSGNTK